MSVPAPDSRNCSVGTAHLDHKPPSLTPDPGWERLQDTDSRVPSMLLTLTSGAGVGFYSGLSLPSSSLAVDPPSCSCRPNFLRLPAVVFGPHPPPPLSSGP